LKQIQRNQSLHHKNRKNPATQQAKASQTEPNNPNSPKTTGEKERDEPQHRAQSRASQRGL